MSGTLSKRANEALQAAMQPDETAQAFVPGLAGSAVIVTDRRVFLFSRMPLTRGDLSWWPAEAVISILPGRASLRIKIAGSVYEPEIVPERGAQISAVQSALRSAHIEHPVTQAVAASLTSDTTVQMMTRTYPNTDKGRRDFAADTIQLGARGYRVAAQSQDPGHIHAGRLIATGGLSILAGEAGTRAKGSITVTFEKVALVSAEGPIELLKQLGELRDSGVLTQAEFDAKKSAILKRL